MDCEGNYFEYLNELPNKTSNIKNFDNNFENYNFESNNLGINTDNNYFSFRLNIPENNKSYKDSDNTIKAFNMK